MKRRHFLIGVAATAANLLTPDTSRSQSDIGPHLAVSYEDPGQAIALDFIGLSYESAILAGADYFTPNNASTLGLIRALGENGVIRIGGNTSEGAKHQRSHPRLLPEGDRFLYDRQRRGCQGRAFAQCKTS
jgi:hypothetical protein